MVFFPIHCPCSYKITVLWFQGFVLPRSERRGKRKNMTYLKKSLWGRVFQSWAWQKKKGNIIISSWKVLISMLSFSDRFSMVSKMNLVVICPWVGCYELSISLPLQQPLTTWLSDRDAWGQLSCPRDSHLASSASGMCTWSPASFRWMSQICLCVANSPWPAFT